MPVVDDDNTILRIFTDACQIIRDLISEYSDRCSKLGISGDELVRLSPSTHALIGSTMVEEQSQRMRDRITSLGLHDVLVEQLLDEIDQEIEERIHAVLVKEGIIND